MDKNTVENMNKEKENIEVGCIAEKADQHDGSDCYDCYFDKKGERVLFSSNTIYNKADISDIPILSKLLDIEIWTLYYNVKKFNVTTWGYTFKDGMYFLGLDYQCYQLQINDDFPMHSIEDWFEAYAIQNNMADY